MVSVLDANSSKNTSHACAVQWLDRWVAMLMTWFRLLRLVVLKMGCLFVLGVDLYGPLSPVRFVCETIRFTLCVSVLCCFGPEVVIGVKPLVFA
jgi:hypothetical protein